MYCENTFFLYVKSPSQAFTFTPTSKQGEKPPKRTKYHFSEDVHDSCIKRLSVFAAVQNTI